MLRKLLPISVAVLVGLFSASAYVFADDTPIYLDPSKPIPLRVEDALSRMTVAEKVKELSEDHGVSGCKRLGLPPLTKSEAVHGLADGLGATIFPQAIAMGATWDTDLEGQVGDTIGQEFVDANLSQAWCPVLDVARDPRWGRVEESFGEDPYLDSRMGVAWIEAFQSHNLIATPKHFAAHGAPLGGRDSNDVGYSDRTMREVFLPSFRAAFEEAKAGSVMNAYSTWTDGLPDAESQLLLMGILRQEWGFEGFDVSDCGSVENMVNKFSVAANGQVAAQLAIDAGVSCNCGSDYKNSLLAAVQSGLVTTSALDFAVGRILTTQYKLGLIDHPLPPPNMSNAPGWDIPAHRAVALKAALESIVLLKNQGGLLPLSKTIGSVAVIGPNADVAQTGDYSGKSNPGQLVTVLDGIKQEVSPATVVRYAAGCDQLDPSTTGFADALAAAQMSDAVIMVLGDKSDKTTGENNDRADLNLTGVQEQLLEAVYKTGKPVVLVLVSGKPCTIDWADQNIPAILETWYPGEQGGNATAQVLFGDYDPAGRLPITFPRSSAQLPLYYDYAPSGRKYDYSDMSSTPLYRFGYGLSYTTFKYANLVVTPPPSPAGNATVTADVTNTGGTAGDDVVQLYISHTLSSVVTPVMELKGFQRIHLTPGQTSTVTFTLTPYELSVLNKDGDRVLETGPIKIMVGGASPEALVHDQQKQLVGYATPDQGVGGELDITGALSASFAYLVDAPKKVEHSKPFDALVFVKNSGGMTDVGEVKLYVAGQYAASRRFELNPGQAKVEDFTVVIDKPGSVSLAAVGKYSISSVDVVVR